MIDIIDQGKTWVNIQFIVEYNQHCTQLEVSDNIHQL